MCMIFKESVWSFLWGKVVSVLGLLGIVQTIASLLEPSYVITIANVVRIDYRVWFVLTILLATGVILRVLYVANKYKCLLEVEDSIVIVYSESYYPACRQEQDNSEEIIRVGIRVIGREAAENLEVFPSLFYPVPRIKQYKYRRTNRFALSPMFPDMLLRPVNPGRNPTCFVNLLKHKLGTREVAFCYRDCPTEYMSLNIGKYELDVTARDKNKQFGFRMLLVSFDISNNLIVEAVKKENEV